jgi:hypothetical protein
LGFVPDVAAPDLQETSAIGDFPVFNLPVKAFHDGCVDDP